MAARTAFFLGILVGELIMLAVFAFFMWWDDR